MSKDDTLSVRDAIDYSVAHFARAGNWKPTHCDVRCLINDLVGDVTYSQDNAYMSVLKGLELFRRIKRHE
jgi:hypothetical protein